MLRTLREEMGVQRVLSDFSSRGVVIEHETDPDPHVGHDRRPCRWPWPATARGRWSRWQGGGFRPTTHDGDTL
jgi:hypothetical protein